MTWLPKAKIDVSMFGNSDSYPDNQTTRCIEETIAESLPPIDGLDAALSGEQRFAVLDASIADSRVAFIAAFGDPFGLPASPSVQGGHPVVPVAEMHAS